nr:MAG TPA: hypothetical protein [Bacteriophage sp.]
MPHQYLILLYKAQKILLINYRQMIFYFYFQYI